MITLIKTLSFLNRKFTYKQMPSGKHKSRTFRRVFTRVISKTKKVYTQYFSRRNSRVFER